VNTPRAYTPQELKEVLQMATPMQLAELRVIGEVFNLSIEEVCIEVLKLIDCKFSSATVPGFAELAREPERSFG
jgi:hypothetical protein